MSEENDSAVMRRIRAVEFYSGIGGMHLALSRSMVSGAVVHAYDWDQAACQVYGANYGTNPVERRDISALSGNELAGFDADLWLLSPSCQPYTVLNPLAKGAEDPRAQSFIHLMEDALPELAALGKEPKYMLIENVAGFETSSTRLRVLSTLKALGYATAEFLLTPLQFGIPNSRLRYYLLAKKLPLGFVDKASDLLQRHIPGSGSNWADPRIAASVTTLPSTREVRDYLDFSMQPGSFSIPDRVLEKWGRLFDIVLPSSQRTCCFTRGYTKLAERAGSVLQMNEKLDTTTVFDEFLLAQKMGDPNAVRILDELRLRYFSPDELLGLFNFTMSTTALESGKPFVWPQNISTKTRYKLIGNSVNVLVVSQLINYLFR
ncbi:S-adenosyl-L-methionine-dependent methyltransferase [Trametopsis cervina]|nr:S-adenosyl-L-methionine-dependent methyltransferase [Trametopsis cervina]